jgi:imidazolonepropionase
MHRSRVQEHSVALSPTYLGAHSVPKGLTRQEAAADICQRQLPRLAELRAAGALRCDSIDVFLEKGVFEVDETRAILNAGKQLGLLVNFHGYAGARAALSPTT